MKNKNPIGKHNGNRARVATLTAAGHKARDIAERLGIAIGTVHAHQFAIRGRGKT